MKTIDIAGNRYGRWTVVGRAGDSGSLWVCRCDCGTIKNVFKSNLTQDKSKGCGCATKEATKKRMTTHGGSKTKLYGVWLAMRRRCYLKSSADYINYGGRGIRVCSEWRNSFKKFMKWSMSNGYSDLLTIDRKDNDKDYSPSNCRWVDRYAQSNNKRNNLRITINGITHTSAEWSKICKLSRGTIESRIKRGWSGSNLILPSKLGNNQFTNFAGGVNIEVNSQ